MSQNSRKGRGWQSTIDRLPEDIRVGVVADLREMELTQKQIRKKYNPVLLERDLEPITRSSLNRYSLAMEDEIAMSRDVQEAANQLVGALGEIKGADVGRALTEMVKRLTFDLLMKRGDGKRAEISVDTLNKVALISQRIERSSKISLEREKAIREEAQHQERKRLKAKTLKAVDAAESAGPMTADNLRAIIKDQYGV